MLNPSSGSPSEPTGARRPGTFDQESARRASEKSIEVRQRRALGKRKPDVLAAMALGDLLLVRQRALTALRTPKLPLRDTVDLLKILSAAAEDILDRTQGRPAQARQRDAGTPEDYRAVLESFPEVAAPLVGNDGDTPEEEARRADDPR